MPTLVVEALSHSFARERAVHPLVVGALVVAIATVTSTASAGPPPDLATSEAAAAGSDPPTDPVDAPVEDTSADPPDSPPGEDPDPALVVAPPEAAACVPACRSGFVCHEGQCISACNPVCEPGRVCTDDGECIAAQAPAPAVAPTPTPAPAPSAVPTPTPAATPTPPATVGAPTHPNQPTQPTQPNHPRTGFSLAGELGLRACFSDSCRARDEFANTDIVRPGVLGRFGAAYRFVPWVSAGAEIDLGLHGLKYRDELVERAFLFSWAAVAMATAHPLARTRWDPFLGFGLGFEQDIVRTDGELATASGNFFDIEVRQQTRRGVFRSALGLAVFMDSRISLGARITVDRQFGGRQCFEASFLEQSCTKIRSDQLPDGPAPDVIGDGLGRLFASFGVFARFHL